MALRSDMYFVFMHAIVTDAVRTRRIQARKYGGQKNWVRMKEETRIQKYKTGQREKRMTFGSYNELKQMVARNRPTIMNAILCHCFLNVNGADARKLHRLFHTSSSRWRWHYASHSTFSPLPLCYNSRNPEAMC